MGSIYNKLRDKASPQTLNCKISEDKSPATTRPPRYQCLAEESQGEQEDV